MPDDPHPTKAPCFLFRLRTTTGVGGAALVAVRHMSLNVAAVWVFFFFFPHHRPGGESTFSRRLQSKQKSKQNKMPSKAWSWSFCSDRLIKYST